MACCLAAVEEVLCWLKQGRTFGLATVAPAARRRSCKVGIGEATEGQAAARMEDEAAATAGRQSAGFVRAEEVHGLLEGAAAQEVAGRVYARPGVVGTLGWSAAEAETAAQIVAADIECSAAGDLAARHPELVEDSAPAVAGSKLVAVVLQRWELVLESSLGVGLARSGG